MTTITSPQKNSISTFRKAWRRHIKWVPPIVIMRRSRYYDIAQRAEFLDALRNQYPEYFNVSNSDAYRNSPMKEVVILDHLTINTGSIMSIEKLTVMKIEVKNHSTLNSMHTNIHIPKY